VISSFRRLPRCESTWCEGEVFKFVREYDGYRIFDDRCVVGVQGNNVLSYALTMHPLKKNASIPTKRPEIGVTDVSRRYADCEATVVYRIKGKNVVPVWQIAYDGYLFHYDIE